jgi:hypothetical protein
MELGPLRFKVGADRSGNLVHGFVDGTNNSGLAEFRIVFSGSRTDPVESWVRIRW